VLHRFVAVLHRLLVRLLLPYDAPEVGIFLFSRDVGVIQDAARPEVRSPEHLFAQGQRLIHLFLGLRIAVVVNGNEAAFAVVSVALLIGVLGAKSLGLYD